MRTQRLLALLLIAFAAGCSRSGNEPDTLTLATTTSVQDTGLLDVLLPMFERQSGIKVKAIAVGSGQALELGRRGDADVLLTHAPAAEEKFIAEGEGIDRRLVMHNDTVLLGPPTDPAGIQGQRSITEAFGELARTHSPFVSRGDESGTHMIERQIWHAAGIEPLGDWYLQAGAGMAHTLHMANEKRAYTLSDRGTYLALRAELNLKVLSGGDPLLVNRYSVTLVNPAKHPDVHRAAARTFEEFLLSPKTQRTIGQFGVEKYGQPLFLPR